VMTFPIRPLADAVAGVLKVGLDDGEPHTIEVVPLEAPGRIMRARARWRRLVCLPTAEGVVDGGQDKIQA
jgi:hypothetical protein